MLANMNHASQHRAPQACREDVGINIFFCGKDTGGVGERRRRRMNAERTEEGTEDTTTTSTSLALCELAQRVYLHLLEDAMFDACEREGEDEFLDDLIIS